MAIPTATSFVLLGAALLVLDVGGRAGTRTAQRLAQVVGLIALLGVVGRLYSVPTLSSFVAGTVVMALHTALTFLVLSLGVVFARPQIGVAALITERGDASTLVRRLVPASAVILVVAGWFRLAGERAGLFGPELGTALMVLFAIVVIRTLVWQSAWSLRRTELIRREAQERLRQSQEHLAAVLGSIGEGVVTIDPTGAIVSVNMAMERLAGWKQEEAAGHPYANVYPLLDPRGNPVLEKDRLLAKAISSGEVVTSRGYELALLTRDGRRVPVSVTAAPILGAEGQIVGGVDIVRDVSHEKDVDRLKSSLVSTASHELRTPLTMIQGFAELLKTRDLPSDQVRDAADQIHRSSERLSRLIDDLLSVSRIEAGRLEVRAAPVDLAPLISEAVAPFSEGRPVRVNLNGDAPVVVADPDLVHRILTNLLSNAVKYSPPGTSVSVEVHQKGDAIEVAVRDRGVGMNEAERSQLFSKFFRADRQEVRETGGTGLGLFITKNLVEMQGGEMSVESEPGHGSTFTFTLPAAVEARVRGGT